MKQFWIIFRFEMMNYLKNKIFVGMTIAFVVLIAGVMFFPMFREMYKEDFSTGKPSDEKAVMLLVDGTEEDDFAAYYEGLLASFGQAFGDYEVKDYKDGLKKAKKQVTSGRAECLFVIKGPAEYDYYVDNLSMYDVNTDLADGVISGQYQLSGILQAGLDAEDAQKILNVGVRHNVTSLGKNQAQNFYYTYIMLFALYMVILLYGQMIATNVASEKGSRAMELLVTSAKPVSMMFGKVIASCIAGLVQVTALFGTAILSYNLNKDGWEDNPIVPLFFDMPVFLFWFMLLFFVLGFFIYAFMYGAIGSLATKVEDVNTTSMAITMVFLVAFIVVLSCMTGNKVDSALMVVCSYVPFTSPMAMFTRIAMSTVPPWEIVLSVAILIVSVAGVGVLSAKIYRAGVLMYGKIPKFGELVKSIK